jgi:hypothetical protein
MPAVQWADHGILLKNKSNSNVEPSLQRERVRS